MNQPRFDIEYAKKVIDIEARGVQSLSELVCSEEFTQALELIFSCQGAVIITGIGKAGLVGQKISATMSSVGTPSHFLHPVEAVHGDLGRVRPGDLVLGLSFGGETDEMIRLMNLIKQQGIKMIAVTGNNDSRLATYCDVTLCIGKLAEACPLGVAPTVSTTAMLALGDALALTVMKAHDFTAVDYARYHPGGSLGAKLITVGQSMDFKRDDELPAVPITSTLKDMLKETKGLKRRGAVMATDAEGKLAGILTDADFRRAICDHGEAALEMTVKEAMTPDCKYVTEETLAAEAMAIFHKYRIDDLPVVDNDKKPVGMIDVQDIVSIKVVG